MNLYLISRIAHTGYDQYDAFVIRAAREQETRTIAALSASYVWEDKDPMENKEYCVWALPEGSSIEVLATNVEGESGEVLGSFNAG